MISFSLIFKPSLIWTLISDGDDLDKFAAEEAAMDTTADGSAASKSQTNQAVEGLREVEGEDKPPGDEEEDWLSAFIQTKTHNTPTWNLTIFKIVWSDVNFAT